MLCDCFVRDAAKYDVVQRTKPAQKDKRGWTALHHAAYDNSAHDVERLLKDDPTQMFVKTNSGNTALSLAVKHGNVESLLCFMKYQLVDPIKGSMLHIAIKRGQLGIVDAMVPSCNNVQLHYALELATIYGYVHIVRSLSRFIPSDFIVHGKYKYTLLHIAAMHDQLDILQYLCSICSSEIITVKDTDGDTVLSCAIKRSSFELVKFLVDTYPQLLYITNDANWNVLMQSQFSNNYQATNYLLDRYSLFMHLKTEERMTPLHLASCIHIAERLHALDPTMIDVVTITGRTALHEAVGAQNENVPLIKYLLALRPAAISAKDAFGCTPFDCVLETKFDKTVKMIITLMPDLDDVDSHGNTMLHIATKHFSLQEDESTLQRVFDSHAKDTKTPNKDGDTPYHVARAQNNQFAIRIYEHNVCVADMFDIHTQYNPLDTSELQRSVAKECVSLDIYLLPDLNFLAQEFLGTSKKNKKRKL